MFFALMQQDIGLLMPAPKKVSRLLKRLVSVTVLPDGLGLHSRRGFYSSKRATGCNPGSVKAHPSAAVTPLYHQFSLQVDKTSSIIAFLQCQDKTDVYLVSKQCFATP